MHKSLFVLPVLCVLGACGDPLAGIGRVSELPEGLTDGASATALPSQAEIDNREPIFANLFRRSTPRKDPAVDAAVSEAINAQAPAVPAPDGAVVPAVSVAAAPIASAPADAVVVAALPADPVVSTPEPARRGGVLTWLRRAAALPSELGQPEDASVDAGAASPDPSAQSSTLAAVVDPPVPVEDEKIAALTPDTDVGSAPVIAPEPEKRTGLFGRRASGNAVGSRRGPDARDVTYGTVLPFGEIARVCDLKPGKVAKIVEKAARKGRGYVLYDSAPNSATPRTFYVTGFEDNCARQFTAALALFGTAELHEQLRYGLPAKEYPYSTTDEAYERVKSSVCQVGRTKPCGSRISRLEKTTVFISTYENFGENARWADLLLHDGVVLAAALKTP